LNFFANFGSVSRLEIAVFHLRLGQLNNSSFLIWWIRAKWR